MSLFDPKPPSPSLNSIETEEPPKDFSPKDPLEILLEAVTPEKREAVVRAWHEHVSADPQSIAAQWALVHFSLVTGMRENTARVAFLRSKLGEDREELDKERQLLTGKFRVEDSQTAAQMGEYLKVIEAGTRDQVKRLADLENATQTVRSVTENANRQIERLAKSTEELFSWVTWTLLSASFLAGAGSAYYLLKHVWPD